MIENDFLKIWCDRSLDHSMIVHLFLTILTVEVHRQKIGYCAKPIVMYALLCALKLES